jgi:hypothetical protein
LRKVSGRFSYPHTPSKNPRPVSQNEHTSLTFIGRGILGSSAVLATFAAIGTAAPVGSVQERRWRHGTI